MTQTHIRDDIAIRLILNLEDTSEWLRGLILSGCERDPAATLHDLEVARIAFTSAMERRVESRGAFEG